MSRSTGYLRYLLPLLAAASGCTVPKDAGFADVHRGVAERSGHRVHWARDQRSRELVAAEVRKLLAEPLSSHAAVRVALLNNPNLQANYERLGVAQADLVQAGMLDNPSLSGALRLPLTGPLGADIDGALGLNFLKIFTIAGRKRIAELAFQEAKLMVTHQVLSLEAEVCEAFVEQQAAQQRIEVSLAIAQAAQASWDSARALHEAGNINDLRLTQEQDLYENARLALLAAQGEQIASREQLNRLLGLWGPQTDWHIQDRLRGLPREDPPLAPLITLALRQRLDLAAMLRRTEANAARLGLARDWGWLHGAGLGANLERDYQGRTALGPELNLQLPLFDQGQAQRASMLAQLRASQQHTSALAITIRSEVRLLRQQLLNQRRRAEHYRDVIIPLRERTVQLTERHYNFMLKGVFELLEQRQRESQAYRDYIDAVRDYWLSYYRLRLAVGGQLAVSPAAPAAPKP